MRLRRRVLPAVTAVCAFAMAACGAPGSAVAPIEAITSGTYTGTDSAGLVTWNIQQSAPNQPVTGTGTFTSAGSGAVAAYHLQGTYQSQQLTLRLVGAPGDTNADSVWFTGLSVSELYTGAAFSGSLMGPTPWAGALSMYLSGTH